MYFVAVALTLFYGGNIPVKIAVLLRFAQKPGFGAGIAVFENRFARKKARRRALGLKKHLPWKKLRLDTEKLTTLPSLMRSTRVLLRHLSIEEIHINGTVSAQDAAVTALLCGGAEALRHALLPVWGAERVDIRLKPDFSGGETRAELAGMVSVRTGHIILAALIGAFDYGNGRLAQWINTQLKVS